MSVSSLFFLAVYAVGLILAFRRPTLGLCAYMWAFYNHPPSRWWGVELPAVRWSFVAAIVLAIGYAFHQGTASTPAVRARGPRPLPFDPTRQQNRP